MAQIVSVALALAGAGGSRAEARPWTDTKGAAVEAEYVSSTADFVTLRQPNGQALRVKLTDLSDADREFVAQKRAAEKESNMIDVAIKGQVVWRLPGWSSLSWSNKQSGEIWLWDDAAHEATEKVATMEVDYTVNNSNRNQFEGVFATKEPVRIPKDARLIVKSQFNVTVNGASRELEEMSVPMSLPQVNKGVVKLPAVRLTITR